MVVYRAQGVQSVQPLMLRLPLETQVRAETPGPSSRPALGAVVQEVAVVWAEASPVPPEARTEVVVCRAQGVQSIQPLMHRLPSEAQVQAETPERSSRPAVGAVAQEEVAVG